MEELSKEKKELLLKDLGARIPFGARIEITSDDGIMLVSYKMTLDARLLVDLLESEDEFKLYLRPMASMTDEERRDFYENLRPKYDGKPWESLGADIDWLNAHHFDYRGLIEKNLAIDCTGLDIYD